MFEIVKKEFLNSNTVLLEINAPFIAKKAEPGQFIMLRIDENGERIPLTIADFDREKGTVTIIAQMVGHTTRMLGELEEGDFLLDFVGPLGNATHVEGLKKVAIIGGGLGTAIAYPQAKKLHNLGAEVHFIAGFRNKDIIILEDKIRAVSDVTVIATDDGSNGNKGFVTDMLNNLIDQGNKYDCVIAIGPLIMMKFVCEITKKHNIKTIISMNPIMIDGTGMCGGCRVNVGGETKFACVDGPEFDGHLVDFDLAIQRQGYYKQQEILANENHRCRMRGEENG